DSINLFCVIDGIIYPFNQDLYYKIPAAKEISSLIAPGATGFIRLNNGTVRVEASREGFDNSKTSENALTLSLNTHLDLLKSEKEKMLNEIVDAKSLIKVLESISGFLSYNKIKGGDYTSGDNDLTLTSYKFQWLKIEQFERQSRKRSST